MGAEKDIIIAVELASTAIRAIAGKREPDGSIKVLAYAQEEVTSTIRKGIIDNIEKTQQALAKVTTALGEKLGVKVKRIYIGLSGQSLHTVANRVEMPFENKELITNETVDKLRDINSGTMYPNAEIKDVIAQEYRIGSRQVVDPVGMQSDALEANFMNIIARTSLEENIRKCVHSVGLEVEEVLITPLALADCILPASEKRSGCALVDMGAETTTICVFSGNILRELSVIPVGGANVTADIKSLKMDIEEAEALKKKYGTAFRQEREEKSSRTITISYDRTIQEDTLQEIVEARYEEIIANAWEHIKMHEDKILSGIILAGGAARIPDITKAFAYHASAEMNVRLAKGLPENVSIESGVSIGDPERMYNILGLLLKGKVNCVAEITEETPQQVEEAPENTVPEKEEVIAPEETPEEQVATKPKSGKKTIQNIWGRLRDMLTDTEDEE